MLALYAASSYGKIRCGRVLLIRSHFFCLLIRHDDNSHRIQYDSTRLNSIHWFLFFLNGRWSGNKEGAKIRLCILHFKKCLQQHIFLVLPLRLFLFHRGNFFFLLIQMDWIQYRLHFVWRYGCLFNRHLFVKNLFLWKITSNKPNV